MRRRACRMLAPLAILFAFVAPALAQLSTQPIVGDVSGAVAFVQDPVLANTFYVVRQAGRIEVLQNGVLLNTPLLDLTQEVTAGGERGLLGLAFSPNVASGWLFVNFTNTNGDTVVARFRRDAGAPVAVPNSRLDLEWPTGGPVIDQPAANHNGGHLAFGPDGFLYIGLGDGGGANNQYDNAQNPNSLLGKMLRIDVNVGESDTKGYKVPANNPFVGLPTFGEIWAFGLRNPWRYSFDNPALGGTGALIIGDVGQGAREEVNYEPAGRGGRNYGWPNREGSIATPGITPPPPLFLPLTDPLFEYQRELGRAVTGGYIYRGSALPASFRGRYFVADSETGLVGSVGLSIRPQTGEAVVADAIDHTAEIGVDGSIVSFAEDFNGELYLVRQGGNVAVAKIIFNGAGLPTAPENLTGQVGGSAVQLSWGPPSNGTPTEYQLEVGSTSGASDLLVTRISGALTSLGASGVANGRYFVRLRGVNGVGAGVASNEVLVQVGCASAPAAPTNLAQNVAGSLVTLSWNAVADASAYTLAVGLSSGANDFVLPVGSATSVSGAAPAGTYFVRAHAQNACGFSGPSNEVTVVIP